MHQSFFGVLGWVKIVLMMVGYVDSDGFNVDASALIVDAQRVCCACYVVLYTCARAQLPIYHT